MYNPNNERARGTAGRWRPDPPMFSKRTYSACARGKLARHASFEVRQLSLDMASFCALSLVCPSDPEIMWKAAGKVHSKVHVHRPV